MDEDKQGIYTGWALAGILVVLSVVLLGVAGPGGIVGALADGSTELSEGDSGSDEAISDSSEEPAADSPSDDGLVSGSPDEPTADPPSGLSFLCGDAVETETSSTATQLSVEQKNEAEKAAESFVMAAYGFEGSDAAAHEQGVEEQVAGDCFWGSYPGSDTENMNEAVRSGAPRSASSDEIIDSPYFARAFVLFDVDYTETVEHTDSGAEYLRTEGRVVWLTEDSEGLYPREQTVTLVKKSGEGQWKVIGGNTMPPQSSGYDQQVEEKIEELEGAG